METMEPCKKKLLENIEQSWARMTKAWNEMNGYLDNMALMWGKSTLSGKRNKFSLELDNFAQHKSKFVND